MTRQYNTTQDATIQSETMEHLIREPITLLYNEMHVLQSILIYDDIISSDIIDWNVMVCNTLQENTMPCNNIQYNSKQH